MMVAQAVKVWDWPVRLSHWSFALIIPAMWWTAENGEMGWHMRLGLLLMAIVIFRICWGFLGSSTARFADFVRGPVSVLAYLRGQGSGNGSKLGHNPIGGWAVLALLAVMLVQTGLGLFAGDPFDGATGPLNETIGVLLADQLTEWHATLFWGIVGLVALHLLAVALYHLIGRKNLVGPMITGRRKLTSSEGAMLPAPLWRLILSIAIAAVIVVPIANGMIASLVNG